MFHRHIDGVGGGVWRQESLTRLRDIFDREIYWKEKVRIHLRRYRVKRKNSWNKSNLTLDLEETFANLEIMLRVYFRDLSTYICYCLMSIVLVGLLLHTVLTIII